MYNSDSQPQNNQNQDIKTGKQEGQDGPGSLPWIFGMTIAKFFLLLSEKNLQEFLYVCTVQVAPIY